MNRRSFLQTAGVTLGVLTVLPTLALAEERRRGSAAGAAAAPPALVDPKAAAAKAVHYVHNTSDIKDAALKTERNGMKFEAQNCKNCIFYVGDKEITVAGKKAAPCQIPFAAGKVVAAAGWCTTWAKKA